MSDYPEHDKLAEVRNESQAIGEFIDLGPYTLCEYDSNSKRYWPIQQPISRLLAQWFEIDEDRLEAEKRAMLDHLVASNI